ncbi:hypothetical protein CC78DRAFT_533419 [Lojkania enalia]|uniref:Uncharacterized protein n=1 Tax=Lojkania enalia TaxID=147567 RepID=A0A9P4N412_9PLEO|nr:hypothetical protein CC78DRAFT_533419 [Didymosphaeria enalia]
MHPSLTRSPITDIKQFFSSEGSLFCVNVSFPTRLLVVSTLSISLLELLAGSFYYRMDDITLPRL